MQHGKCKMFIKISQVHKRNVNFIRQAVEFLRILLCKRESVRVMKTKKRRNKYLFRSCCNLITMFRCIHHSNYINCNSRIACENKKRLTSNNTFTLTPENPLYFQMRTSSHTAGLTCFQSQLLHLFVKTLHIHKSKNQLLSKF